MRNLVCVVDDDEIFRAKLAAMLEMEGFAVVSTGDPREVPALIEKYAPRAVVVDMIMPEKDGVELIGELHRQFPDLRIIAMSGGGRIGPDLFLGIARKLGAFRCITKPFTAADIRDAITAP